MNKNPFLAHVTSLLAVVLLCAGTAGRAGLLPQDGEAQYELEFWQSIQNSTDAEDYEAYLEAYPNGKFAPLARSRAERYRKAAAPPAPQAAVSVSDMDIYYDVVADANIRRAPSSQSDKLGVLQRGSRVHVTGKVADKPWYRVQTDDNVTAFVYAELLREPAAKVAQPAPIPAPAPAAPSRPSAPTPPPAPVEPRSSPAVTTAQETLRDCPSCPEMVVVPAGSYVMGDAHGDISEKPAHRVTIKQPFAIGKYEVTRAQWNQCVEAGGCKHKLSGDGDDKTPVGNVSWVDAHEYTAWLSKTTGKHYRLPTEAEWEYAARAGTTTRYWWGNDLGSGKANCKNCGGAWDRDKPAEVDAYSPNPFGLYGTSGGVWEWVTDCWHHDYSGAPVDGSSWEERECRENVIRGGAWRNDSTYVHSASRFKYEGDVRYLMNGFRVARSVP